MKPYEQYKNSGINWLGQVPSHWEICIGMMILKENKRSNKGMKENTVLSLSYGEIIVKDESKLFGLVPESFETYQIVEPNDIIIRCTDLQNDKTSLRTGLAKNKGIITSAYLNLGVKQGYYAKFIHYYLHTLDITKVIYGLGSGLRQNLSFLDFRRLPFPLPPLPEQLVIAKFLDEKTTQIQMAIGIKNEQIAKLKEYRQALINQTVTKGLNANIPMKNSGVEWLGEVPSHWEVKKLKFITSKIGSGITPSGGALNYLDSGIPLLRSQNVHFDRLDLKDVAFISEKTHHSMFNSQVKKGDILLNITGGSIGRCYYVDTDDEMNVNQHVCIVRPKTIETKFLNYVLASDIGQEQVWYFQQGGGREGLNFQALKNFYIPYPNILEQLAIAEFLDEKTAQIDTAITHQQNQIERLKEYQQSLVNDAVTGKIRVKQDYPLAKQG